MRVRRARAHVCEWVGAVSRACGVVTVEYVRKRVALGGARTHRCALCWCNRATRSNGLSRLAACTGQHLRECACFKIFFVFTLDISGNGVFILRTGILGFAGISWELPLCVPTGVAPILGRCDDVLVESGLGDAQ